MAEEETAWEKSFPGSEGPKAGRGLKLPRISKHMYVAEGTEDKGWGTNMPRSQTESPCGVQQGCGC